MNCRSTGLAACALLLLGPGNFAVADSLTPGMARFYIVDDTGRSQPSDPSVETIGTPEPGQSRVVVGARQPTASPRRERRIVVRRKPMSEPDAFEEFRCERVGLYYTSDGRCVVPAYGRRATPGS